MVDLLVSIVVVTLLIALLLPSLGTMREAANQVICRSNVRQIGIGIALYAEANQDYVMPSAKVSGNPTDNPTETVVLRLAGANAAAADRWDGLGILYSGEYLPTPKLYYCPSHKGQSRFDTYADQWSGKRGEIQGNYQYRVRVPASDAVKPMGHARPQAGQIPAVRTTMLLGDMKPGAALLVDSLKSQLDFNHKIGANVLRASLAVSWYEDTNGDLFGGLPSGGASNPSQVQYAWSQIDD